MAAVDLPVGSGPYMMLVNPGKRKRFHVLNGDLEEQNMSKIFYWFLNFKFEKIF